MATTHPLAYAVLEIRIPFSPRLVSQDAAGDLAALLPELPVLRQEQRPQTSAGNSGIALTTAPAWRFLDRASTRSFVVSSTALVYETTRYPGYKSFERDAIECLAAISEVGTPVGYDRLGLRYVNEVRREEPVERFGEWRNLIAPGLIESLTAVEDAVRAGCDAPRTEDQCRLETADSTLVFALPDNSALTLRMANLEGAGVVGNDPLKRFQMPEAGPFYVVDFDGYWPRQQSDIRPFELSEIVALMERVHRPVKAAFQWATTPSYRNEAGVVTQ